MSSRERMVLRVVLWLVGRFLSDKYRLMTPQQLNQVVDDYLAELPKLGINLVYAQTQVGNSHDEITANGEGLLKEDQPPRQSGT